MINQLQNIIKKFSFEELQVIKTLVIEMEKQKLSIVKNSLNIKNFALEYFIYIQNNYSLSYLKSVTLSFSHLIKFFSEQKVLNEITVKDAEDFKAYIMKTAPRGVQVYIRTIRAAFSKGIDWEMLTTNPFAKIKITQHQQVVPKFLTMSDLKAVLKNTSSPVIRSLFIFGFFTGCRLGEIINLKWDNVDLEQKAIRIGDEKFTSKNRKSRLIPMSNEIVSILKTIPGDSNNNGYVFSKDNGFRFNRDYISRSFKKSVRKAGLGEELHFHSLRHSFASNLALKGVPIIVIKDLLGHSSIVTTQIYSHSDFDSLKKAIDKFNE